MTRQALLLRVHRVLDPASGWLRIGSHEAHDAPSARLSAAAASFSCGEPRGASLFTLVVDRMHEGQRHRQALAFEVGQDSVDAEVIGHG